MIEKVTHFLGQHPDFGQVVFPLFGTQEGVFEKVAAPSLLPEVQRYIDHLRPLPDSQYILVNALGAGEFYGSNSNGDYFDEEGLRITPTGWSGDPEKDRALVSKVGWGFPTFYNANAFVHHQNQKKERAVGTVEFVAWNPVMHRVELVMRLDRKKCLQFGGSGVWEKIRAGGFPDVSMGCRVPFDLCSITLDSSAYRDAVMQFKADKETALNEGQWLARFHKQEIARGKLGIRGLQITRKDYSTYAREMMGKVFGDGRKVFVVNPHPGFFDISCVFIGADKTGKTMVHISISKTPVGEGAPAPAKQEEGVKTAALLPKAAGLKKAQIDKRVPGSMVRAVVPAIAEREPELSTATADALSKTPLGPLLATLGLGGVILRPREFQRIIMVRIAGPREADDLDRHGLEAGEAPEGQGTPLGLDGGMFDENLADLFDRLLPQRSGFGPFVEKRIILGGSQTPTRKTASHQEELLRKISAAYRGYREELSALIPQAVKLAGNLPQNYGQLVRYEADSLFTPLAQEYFARAHR